MNIAERSDAIPAAARGPGAGRPTVVGVGGPRALQRLQAGAGNAAVVALLQRQRTAAGAATPTGAHPAESAESAATAPAPTADLVVQRKECPAPPAPPAGTPPGDDPGFTKVAGKVAGEARAAKQHPPAAAEVAKAQSAAVPPANDVASQAKAAQAGDMAAARPGAFDKAAFVAAVRRAVEAASPKTLEEADGFAASGKAAQVKEQVGGMVSGGKRSAERDVKEKAAAAPDPARATPKPVTPLDEAPQKPPPADPKACGAMPKPAPAEQVALGAERCETDDKMARAGVSDAQLAKSNEPQFTDALAAKRAGEAHSATAPAAFRAQEQGALQAAAGTASGQGLAAVTAMAGARTTGTAGARTQQGHAQSRDETERARIAGEIEAIFTTTKTEAEAALSGLDAKVDAAFTSGEATARAAFEAQQSNEMRAWKDLRYGGIGGAAQWVIDKVMDPPPEVNAISARARTTYMARMDVVIGDVADLVGAELTRATTVIAAGKQRIESYVKGLAPNLRRFGQEAAQQIGGRFEELERAVTEKRDGLVDSLATKYVEARTAIDARVQALQDENKGLWSQAKEAVGGVIDTITQLKDMLLSTLSRAAGAIDRIIGDPIGFLGNLVNAVKSGLSRFVGNIGEHLKKGLLGWLFGALGSAGIEIPTSFDLKGILKLVLSVLGLTWANIRSRIVRQIGERAMAGLEGAVGIVQTLVSEGPAGLWRIIVQKIGDFKDMVLGQIKDFVITKIITAGITWLLSMLNPAGAFIKACKAIIDIVRFFIERGSQIVEFVNTVTDSIGAIVSGALGGAAAAIENVLGRILPLAISFLASLLGLGGIGERIKSILETVRAPVNRAIDAVIGGIIRIGKRLFAPFAARASGQNQTPAQKQQRLDAGLAAGRAAVNRFAGRSVGASVLGPLLSAIRLRYRMASLGVAEQGGRWVVRGAVNPEGEALTDAKATTLDAAKVRQAIAAAKSERSRAQAEHQAREAALRARGTESAATQADRLTIAAGGGQIRQQGGGSLADAQRDPAAAARWLEADAAVWAGSKRLTQGRLGEMLEPLPGRPATSTKMTDFRYPAALLPSRRAHQEATGEYVPGRGLNDAGVPGSTNMVHAEKLLRQAAGNVPIGVSRAMCPDCQQFFKAAAAGTDFLVVADPTVRVFLADGSVKGEGDFA